MIFEDLYNIIMVVAHAGVMELADVPDSKSGGGNTVPVRPRSPAPDKSPKGRNSLGAFAVPETLSIYRDGPNVHRKFGPATPVTGTN